MVFHSRPRSKPKLPGLTQLVVGCMLLVAVATAFNMLRSSFFLNSPQLSDANATSGSSPNRRSVTAGQIQSLEAQKLRAAISAPSTKVATAEVKTTTPPTTAAPQMTRPPAPALPPNATPQQRMHARIQGIKDRYPELTDTTRKGTPGKYFDVVRAHVDCDTLIKDGACEQAVMLPLAEVKSAGRL